MTTNESKLSEGSSLLDHSARSEEEFAAGVREKTFVQLYPPKARSTSSASSSFALLHRLSQEPPEASRQLHRMPTKIVYDLVQASDIDRAFEIETEGFPEDEAASLESLQSVFLTSETPIRETTVC